MVTVLEEVVDGACELTGAHYGVIATVDRDGTVRDFVTSGFSPEERRRFAEWPDGPRLFAHLRNLPGPLRLADLPDYVHERGFSPELMSSKTLQSMPMRYRGEQLGNLFVAEKADAETFTSEDEEVLELFAAQAAAAIVNARTHRDEQRARADLEALVETSPIGVAVCDARTGRVVSVNGEARRLVDGLIAPDVAQDEAHKTLTCRFADGTELPLAEVSLVRALGNAQTRRAEEVELSVPDGRSARALVNVTPIRDQDGTVVSVVVTMQDLGPLEELERLRAEFLGMVSHELRAPLTSIKGCTSMVLGSSPTPSRAEMLQFFRIVDGQADHMRGLIGNLLDAGRIEAGTLSVDPEPLEIASLVDAARQTFASGGARHTVVVDLPSDLPPVMADRERAVQVLNNLLSNAARHSPESSPIGIEAVREDVHVAVTVSDEGRGIPPEMLGQLFEKHVAVSGESRGGTGPSGLGLAICKGLVEAHGGRIRAESAGLGRGARLTFTLPAASAAAEASAPAAKRAQSRAAAPERHRILVVDDDPETLRLVRHALIEAGYGVVQTGTPDEVAGLIRDKEPSLVLLDLMLPGIDGIELMQQVPELSDLPVIFVSGYGRDETIARAFEIGVQDYIVKPFSATELVARVGAALRRHAGGEPFTHGELLIDYERRRVTMAGRVVALTATEYELLRVLSVNAGRVVTSASLLRQVWGARDSTDTEPLRAFVKKLRDKLGDNATRPNWIFNERGVGYRMSEAGEA